MPSFSSIIIASLDRVRRLYRICTFFFFFFCNKNEANVLANIELAKQCLDIRLLFS